VLEKEEKEERKEKERKKWVEPELIKCDEPLDEVTMQDMNESPVGPEA